MGHSTCTEEEIALVKEMRDKCKFNEAKVTVKDVSDNNNGDYFKNDHSKLPNENGRLSGGSPESAFSYGSETEESSQSDSYNNLSSGRSSANQDDKSDGINSVDIYCDNSQEVKQASKFVDKVRVRFLDSLNADPKDTYDPLDVAELREPLCESSLQEQRLAFRLISRYLDFKKLFSISKLDDKESEKRIEKDIDEATENLKELLKFRQHFQLSSVLPDDFTKEFHILSGAIVFGHDRKNLPVLYLRACVHRKWSPKLDDMFRRWAAWQVDQLSKSNHNAQVGNSTGIRAGERDGAFGICFDCKHVSYSCLDMDFLRFLVRILVNYYPNYCRYALCIDLPWLFRSVWKLVRSWLPQDAQETVLLLTSKELVEYIDPDQIPNSITFNEMKASEKPIKNKHPIPKNFDSLKEIDHLAKELNLSPNEIKQFKTHVGKVQKEYESCGAL